MTTRKRKGDKKLAEGLELEGFVVAGTPAALEALTPGQAESPHCVRCGSQISNVFLTSKGPMGGDCLATLTGDPSTRRLGRKLAQKLDQVSGYREVTGLLVKPGWHGDYNVVAVSIDRDDYDSWTGLYGTRTDFLASAKENQLPVLLAIAGYEAEIRGLSFETEGIEQIVPYDVGRKNPQPKGTLFHGTSRNALEDILRGSKAYDLYLADSEAKSWDYAEQSAERDDSEVAMLVLDASRLPGDIIVDPGVSPEEWDYEMGQWIYTGQIPVEAIQGAYYIDDYDETVDMVVSRRNTTSTVRGRR